MLPGKLCIGILEEDNPLKSYFRLKPLLMEADGKYEAFEGGESYPEEGCIRIVPDKNESSHFKARMRRMGRYCVLDLREHAGENDKIRPNKNYHGDESERNAHIVYSDVVREPAEDMIFEVASEPLADGDWTGDAPGTRRLLSGDGLETWTYTAPEAEGAPGRVACDGGCLNADEVQRFELPGFSGETLRFAIRLPGRMASVTGAPQRPAKAEKAAEPPAEAQGAPKAKEAEPAPQAEKPWISHDLPKPAPARQRLSPLQQALAAQSGLNPRRNRSLQEIIEDKWRHSRVDQLGHPVPAKAMGQPVESPLERAVNALREAWRIPEIHERLLASISEMGTFTEALNNRRRELMDSALRRELEDLEAERLKSLGELDRLRREKNALRETFKREIREEEADALREAVERTRAAQEECARQEAAAAEARRAAEYAQDAFAALSDGRFEEKLKEFALTSRAAELIANPVRQPAPRAGSGAEAPSRGEWLDRARRALTAEGLESGEVQAANLLVCAALSDSLLFSGPASSDKAPVARALARALGAVGAGRYAETAGSALPAALTEDSDLPAVALVLNANAAPEVAVDRGFCGTARNLIVISALSDGGTGCPVSAEALERGFFIRLEPADAQSPWKCAAPAEGNFAPATMDALRAAFLPQEAELPAALERRLQKLRDALAEYGVRLSRNTLNLMWKYCAAMLALGKISAAEALDLAFAQKALPCILAEAPVECLLKLSDILSGMPHSLALLSAPLPIQI